MKEKYKDQVKLLFNILLLIEIKQIASIRESVKDDEERELRMKLLQSSGSQDEEAKSRKKKKESRGLEKLYGKAGTGRQQSIMSKSNLFCRRQQAKGTTKGSEAKGTASQTGGWRWGRGGGEGC